MDINPNKQQQKLNPDLAKSIVCEKCDGTIYSVIFFIKRISALVSPTGKDQVFPIQTFECRGCGHINDEFNPDKQILPGKEEE